MKRRHCNPEHPMDPETAMKFSDPDTGLQILICGQCWERICMDAPLDIITMLMERLDDGRNT